jgi:hypothetical protein
MEAIYDTLYIIDSVVGIIIQVIGICALCVWIITMKGR